MLPQTLHGFSLKIVLQIAKNSLIIQNYLLATEVVEKSKQKLFTINGGKSIIEASLRKQFADIFK